MRKLSSETKERIDIDPFYNQCCICRSINIQIHHNLIYAGRQVDDAECLLPLCENCHSKARNVDFKEKLDLIMYKRMTLDQFAIYSRSNLLQRYDYLKKKYHGKI